MADKLLLSRLMDDLGLIYDKPISVDLKRLYHQDLGHLDNADLEAAALAHRRDPDRGRFFPKPADLLAKVPTRAAVHPSADVAWTLALRSFDESATVVWTDLIAAARSVAMPCWEDGDKIGARMAFRAAYEQALACSSAPPRWSVSQGFDQEGRAQVVQEAVNRGLLPAAEAARYLPAPAIEPGPVAAVAGLLTGKVVALPVSPDAVQRRRLEALRAAVEAGPPAGDDRAAVSRAAFAQRKREALDALAHLQAGQDGVA